MALLFATPAVAADVINFKTVSLELARDLAQAAVDSCRASGYQVTAIVVNRSGDAQAMLRDSMAPRYTMQIAREKAEAVILSGVASGEFRRNRQDIRMEMNHVQGILVLEGGLPIRAGGSLLGALGVSGAPGGDKDEACAQAALSKLQERLEFAE
ncbi:MAG: heme-binding protein [Hydrogenophilales bacterium]|nr:heme-binding protein [Hydrogenophilales bacterium]